MPSVSVSAATAGRPTLNGEGLKHEDGHSPLIAATNPAVVAYDPAFAFESAHIVEDGLRRMYGEQPEDIYYYLTLYNEPIFQPAQPADLDVAGPVRGGYPPSPPPASGAPGPVPARGTALQGGRRAHGSRGP